jgi:hypothetical protein
MFVHRHGTGFAPFNSIVVTAKVMTKGNDLNGEFENESTVVLPENLPAFVAEWLEAHDGDAPAEWRAAQKVAAFIATRLNEEEDEGGYLAECWAQLLNEIWALLLAKFFIS